MPDPALKYAGLSDADWLALRRLYEIGDEWRIRLVLDATTDSDKYGDVERTTPYKRAVVTLYQRTIDASDDESPDETLEHELVHIALETLANILPKVVRESDEFAEYDEHVCDWIARCVRRARGEDD